MAHFQILVQVSPFDFGLMRLLPISRVPQSGQINPLPFFTMLCRQVGHFFLDLRIPIDHSG
jgi:hypothetical protein